MPTRLRVEPLEVRALPAPAFQTLPVLPDYDPAALDHARAILAHGRDLGRNDAVVLKVGDSNSSTYPLLPTNFLAPLGSPAYDPNTSGLAATFGNLVATWQAFHSGPDSLAHEGPAAKPGFTTTDVLAALPGEIAATNAGVALVMIGTNDAMLSGDPALFRTNLSRIVTRLVGSGIVPVLSTIPDNHYLNGQFEATVLAFDQVIADVAERYRVPLWNVWAAMNQLPNQGLDSYGVHLTASPNGAGNFSAADLQFGQNVRNLEALQILDWFRGTVSNPAYVAPRVTWQATPSDGVYAVGRDVGASPTVDVYDAATGALVDRFLAFGTSLGGGVRVATADVNGDGRADVVCGTASGAGVVKVFSGKDGSLLARFWPFGMSYTGGVSIAVGDVTGDGTADVVVGQLSGGSQVRVYAGGSFRPAGSFAAFAPTFPCGVNVAVADVAGAGAEIAVGAAASVPTVRLFTPAGSRVASFRAFDAVGFGVTVAAADLTGDGSDELAATPADDGRYVQVFDPGTLTVRATLTAGPVIDPLYGLRLGTLRSATGPDTLLVGNGPGSRTEVLAFTALTGSPATLKPSPTSRAFGIFVG